MTKLDHLSAKVVSSTLYTTEASEVKNSANKDLEIPDPELEAAEAAIQDAKIFQD